MKRLLTAVLAGLLIGAFAAPAFAWEFEMKGEWEYRIRYFSRTGPNDLFGRDAGDLEIGFSGQNIYGHGGNALVTPLAITAPTATSAGLRIVRGGFSFAGPDAYYNDSRITLRPVVRVNPAIRVFGVYTIGGYRNKYRQWNDVFQGAPAGTPWGVGTPPFERYYMHQTSDNAYDTASIGSWEQFRCTIQTPWAYWSLGVKDFPFGTGATLAENVRAESFFTIVPYGPFRLMLAVWVARNSINAGWGVNPDADFKPTAYQSLAFQYDAGAMSMGAMSLWQKLHVKALYGGTPPIGEPAVSAANRGYDRNLLFWMGFAKYNNGRFFANAEYAWFTMDRYNLGARQGYTEAYHWFAEAGCFCGPAKLTLMAATSSGPVLNYNNPTKTYAAFPVNYQVTQPYEFLMFSTYGGGNQAFGGLLATDDGTGQIADAFVYAARLDYAVASNLNAWGSYMWAHRLEKAGFLFGGVNDTGGVASPAEIALFAANAGRAANPRPAPLAANPFGYVTDGFIGWEVNAGVDWKLLENLTMNVRWSYWQPGGFFKEAYQARVPSPVTSLAIDNQVLTSRDAIQALHGSFLVSF